MHPTTGDCSQCHTTASFLDPTVQRPSNHIPSTALCSQCHTTAGNWALYSVTGVHQGETTCNLCHGPGTGPFAGPPPSNTITIVASPKAATVINRIRPVLVGGGSAIRISAMSSVPATRAEDFSRMARPASPLTRC